ncbi:MAG TPA: undecaprenyldiphospho-muramoylpentapeptide beta-N-acetylglucosaminyltransferase [Gammaproteobacteria bacterium]|nr:undecaprenyldiphospho-muramoylpentapeptide beta-N-acetylglucosaminyltransferase [Gammaproteobacteria bacterium]
MNRPILIMAGGTGGHIYPALAVAEELQRRQVAVHWLGTRRGLEMQLVPQAGLKLHTVTVTGLRRRGVWTWLLAPPVLIMALLQSLWHLLMLRPAAVLGMGGFASGPGGVAAWLLRIPLLLHEQNALLGTTNRLLAPLARRLLEAFPGAFAPRPAVCTGNPVRASITQLSSRSEHPDPAAHPLRILVVGGSQGAAALNRIVPAAVALLITQAGPPRIEVWHQTGAGQDAETAKHYRQHDVTARVEPYLHAIEQAYAWADLVICRAGAMTIAELAVAGLAALLVPYPFAVDDHQTANAAYLARQGAALMIPEHELTPMQLAALVRGLIDHPERRMEMARKARTLARPQAAAQVARFCMEAAYG